MTTSKQREPSKTIRYNPENDSKHMHGYRNVRFVEYPDRGLRFVGYADEIASYIRHRGWYADEDGVNGSFRGVVYQLPARDRCTRYVYGYEYTEEKGSALLCFGDIEGDKEDAARFADRFAEIFAESARDYDRAWSAGRRYDDLAEEIKEARSEALKIGAEIRQQRRNNVCACGDDKSAHDNGQECAGCACRKYRAVEPIPAPAICRTLRNQVFSLRRQIVKMRKERAQLFDDFGNQPGFVE